jgi:hypothetical protein
LLPVSHTRYFGLLIRTGHGDIHVLSAPPDAPTKLKRISAFHALDMPMAQQSQGKVSVTDKGLVTTWWRQSGNLCVGGPAPTVNIWDCPAERCTRVCIGLPTVNDSLMVQMLSTECEAPLTSLITEPVSGNIIIGGFQDGLVKLWDIRAPSKLPCLFWSAHSPSQAEQSAMLSSATTSQSILKVGVVLGEAKHITSAWCVPSVCFLPMAHFTVQMGCSGSRISARPHHPQRLPSYTPLGYPPPHSRLILGSCPQLPSWQPLHTCFLQWQCLGLSTDQLSHV